MRFSQDWNDDAVPAGSEGEPEAGSLGEMAEQLALVLNASGAFFGLSTRLNDLPPGPWSEFIDWSSIAEVLDEPLDSVVLEAEPNTWSVRWDWYERFWIAENSRIPPTRQRDRARKFQRRDAQGRSEERPSIDASAVPRMATRPNQGEDLDVQLPPYESWRGTLQGDLLDLPQARLVRALRAVATVETPMVGIRAYRLLVQASRAPRLTRAIKSRLNRASAAAVRQGILAAANPTGQEGQMHLVLRLPGAQAVRLRQRGDRQLDELPENEIAELAHKFSRMHPEWGGLDIRSNVAEAYELVPDAKNVRRFLDLCLQLNQE